MSSEVGHALLRSNAINPDDHGAIITITTSIMLTCTLLFYVFRLFTRWPLDRLFGKDDAAITIATVLSLGQAVAILASISFGLGKRSSLVSPADADKTYESLFVSDILYVLALCPAKLASSLLIDRLTENRGHILVTRIVSAVIVLWGIVSAIVVAVPCPDGTQPGRGKYVCSNTVARWIGITVTDMVTEVALLLLPVYLLWGLSISIWAKLVVLLAFWSRLPLLALSALRLHSLSTSLVPSNLTFDIVPLMLYTQIDLHYSILAATISSMRPFLRLFNSGFLGTTIAQVEPTTVQSPSPTMQQRQPDVVTSSSYNSTVYTKDEP